MLNTMWPEAQRKRVREDQDTDLASGGTLGFTEHRTKRLQSLPLRTSPNSRRYAEHPSFPLSNHSFASPATPRTITPGESDSEGQQVEQHQQHVWALEPELPPQQPSPWAAVFDSGYGDMDMTDASEEPAPETNNSWQGQDQRGHAQQLQQQQRQHLEPGQFQPDPTAPTITGRMPTPIHCSFAQQLRGNNWNGTAEMGGNVLQGGEPMNSNSMAFNRASLLGDPSFMGHEGIPRSFDGAAATAQVMADWSMVQNRRLPSPISESGGEDGLDSPRMVLDSCSSSQQQQMNGIGNLSHLTHQHPLLFSMSRPAASRSCSSLHVPEHQQQQPPQLALTGSPSDCPTRGTPSCDQLTPRKGSSSSMDIETAQQQPGTSTSPSSISPGRKGHTRSKHTVNSWTALHPGMKRSFSIGYRADCEKCRMKVPGHFNHIIIS